MILTLLTNPIIISVVLMTLLCLFRFNVLLSLLISALVAGVFSHLELVDTMNILISGMKENLKTALSYILLGAIAAAISKTNLTAYLIKIVSHFISHKKYLLLKIVSHFISHKKYLLLLSIALISCFSQNLIPIHVAFIPLLIPPLLSLFNKLKIDRRAVACALTFGLTTPYMVLPVGFGLTFQDLLKDNLNANNVSASLNDVTNTMYFAAICMIAGLFLALFVFYRKPREYQEVEIAKVDLENLEMTRKEWGVLAGLVLTLILQILTMNLPLSGLLGFVLMVILGGVEFSKVNEVFDDGLKMMGFIAFVILVAAGYGEVLKESGSVVDLVNSVVPWMEQSKFLAVFFMLLIGLIITMGIGTSFGTIPIIATLFCPICLELGFSTALIIFILGVAGALGDAGSPASETTMGTTVGLNADKQHDHIKDTCIPTFIFYNGPLLILGSIIAMFL
ncbi:Na+/H+ antiporter family protein [Campylobacter jejuni]